MSGTFLDPKFIRIGRASLGQGQEREQEQENGKGQGQMMIIRKNEKSLAHVFPISYYFKSLVQSMHVLCL
jgi:hypothetical protein